MQDDTEKPKILLVEDQDSVRKFLSLVLEADGFLLTQATDGASALGFLYQENFDLVLLDVTLPDMNGTLVFDTMQAQEKLCHVPVIFLTGEVSPPAKIKALEAGAVDYITKPFDHKELVARIRTHLRAKTELAKRREQAGRIAEKAQISLKAAEQRLSALVKNSFDLVSELDTVLNIVYLSPNHADILNYHPSELEKRSWLDYLHPEDREQTEITLRSMLREAASERLLLRFRDKTDEWKWLDVSGSVYMTEDGERRLLLVSRDITRNKQTEDHLQHLALHDSLTQLGNRQSFNAQFEAMLKSPAFMGQSAVMYIDIDNFKLINDTKGHLIGDQVLRTVAATLKSVLREGHSIARFGGDEFCILMRGVDENSARAEGDRIVHVFREHPIGVAGNSLGITISGGIAMIEADLGDKEILSRANSALHAAKAHGKNRCRFYHSDSEEILNIRNSAEWYHKVREGLEQKHFEIWYQPIFHLEMNVVLCHEALLRYRDENGKLHSPSEFMGSAERYGMMSLVDQYVIDAVLRDLKNNPGLRVSINLSGNSVTDPEFRKFVLNHFRDSRINGNRVIFEVTETIFITNLALARELAESLRELGCSFALDDFGSGFSSLNYLKNLPVDIVKIDGSFIQQISSDYVDLALLKSINEIAHLLGKSTVAEYVDSDETRKLLQNLGVDYGQGFYLGRPAPLTQFSKSNV